MGIAENLSRLKTEIPHEVRIIAVSKTMPVSDILQAYHTGHREFGENKAQELAEKHGRLPSDIAWHMIGHLQTNKVKLIIPFVHLIQSIDSLKLFGVVEAEAAKAGRRIDCLLQVRIAREETKFGLTTDDAELVLKSYRSGAFPHTRIKGMMGMATFTDNMLQVRNEFSKLVASFSSLRLKYFSDEPSFRELSMGMSGDYKIALEEGSTMVRIGSLIFGERNYTP